MFSSKHSFITVNITNTLMGSSYKNNGYAGQTYSSAEHAKPVNSSNSTNSFEFSFIADRNISEQDCILS